MICRVLVLTMLAAATGCARGAYLRPTDGAVPPVPSDAVPQGTLATAQLRQPLSTEKNRVGDRFTLELLDPITDAQGREVVGRGATVAGVVRGTADSGVAGQNAELDLQVLGVESGNEGLLPVPAEVANAPLGLSSALGREVAAGFGGAVVGAGAGLGIDHNSAGVVLGSVAVGAGLGALAGYVFGTRDAELPAGSIVTLRVTQNVRVEHPVATVFSPCAVPKLPASKTEARSGTGPDALAPSPVADHPAP